MKTKILYLILLFTGFCKAQNIYVRYENKITPTSSTTEDLYIKGGKAISIRDSIFRHDQNYRENYYDENTGRVNFKNRDKVFKIRYHKNLGGNDIEIIDYLGDKKYSVRDDLPEIKWNIDYNVSKKIRNYDCYKATGNFRGSAIVAYFTKKIPVATGPYKFSGLPGLILEVYEDGKDYNSWKAEEITVNYLGVIPAINIIHTNAISMEEFVNLSTKRSEEEFKKLTANLPKNVTVSNFKILRNGIEKKYEWEK